MTTLISAQAMAELDRDDVLVVDCRFDLADASRGAREYAMAHVPGAVYADLNRDLCDLARQGLGRHPLPEPEQFSRTLARWGWTPLSRVVAYDDAGGALAAARLWWLLRLAGAIDVAVLDGGFKAWRESGAKVSDAEPPQREQTHVTVNFDPSEIVYTEELQRNRAEILLLDARAAPRFRGEMETIDSVAGHIPGARNRPFGDNLRADGRFKSPDELRAEFTAILAGTKPENVVHSCGSGVTACHNLLAMEHAGLHGSRIYAPSWSGWISEATRAVAVGEA